MRGHPIITIGLLLIFIFSIILLFISVVSINKSNKKLETILDVSQEQVNLPNLVSTPSIDDKILAVQKKLQTASNGIKTKKSQISIHVARAVRAIDKPGEKSLEEAKLLLKDILKNNRIVLERNNEIEKETLRLYSLYQKKIETLLTAQQAQQESSFGITFWMGLIGLLATITGVIFAWRQDSLSHRKEHQGYLKLQRELTNSPIT